jgi:hypothetical protein
MASPEDVARRAHAKIDRLTDRFEAEFESDVAKARKIENRIINKPITASGVRYDRVSDTWNFKTFEDTTGQLQWSFDVAFESDSFTCEQSVIDGPRDFELVAFASTHWAAFAAFAVSSTNQDGKKTKLFTKTNPERNRVYLIVNGNRYRAIEGELDIDVFGPSSEIALVAFAPPQEPITTATIGFDLDCGPTQMPVKFLEELSFPPGTTSIAEGIEERLSVEVRTIQRTASKAKADVSRKTGTGTGCLVLTGAMMLLGWLALVA